ncbi:MAG: SCO family protein [Phycisphaerales bacterium]|nr:SCO family protein [Phycisphaerales bacterium]
MFNSSVRKALLIVLLLPILSYALLTYFSNRAINMPRKLLLDSVATSVVDGVEQTDSFWHQTGNITLVNQLGDTVSLYDKKGKIMILDFFFTHCPYPCPVLTKNMRKLQQSFSHYLNGRQEVDSSVVQFISFTVDSKRDSPSVLNAYALKYGVNPDNWWMLTGPKSTIYNFAFNELKIGLLDGDNVDTLFLHTPNFILLDKQMRVRGLYDGTDTLALARLAHDVGLVLLEKDKTAPNSLLEQIVGLKWLWYSILLIIIIFTIVFYKKQQHENDSKK